MEGIVGIVGIIGVLILEAVIIPSGCRRNRFGRRIMSVRAAVRPHCRTARYESRAAHRRPNRRMESTMKKNLLRDRGRGYRILAVCPCIAQAVPVYL